MGGAGHWNVFAVPQDMEIVFIPVKNRKEYVNSMKINERNRRCSGYA